MSVTAWSMVVYVTVLWCAQGPPAVTVNGLPLSAAEWEFLRLTRGADDELTPELRERLIDQAIERQLIRGFLARRKITAPKEHVDFQVIQLENLIRRRGDDPDTLLPKLGLSRERLRQELGLSLAWNVYVQQAAAEQTLKTYWDEHRSEVDGTRVRVRQIFRKLSADAPDSDRQAAEQLLNRLKADIEGQRIAFDAAAREHSQSPSAEQGGDVGWVGAPGRLPQEVTVAVLKLKPGEAAGPIRTAFGLHLVQVTERQAGQLSLEDARPVILERLSAQWWRETVEKERAAAKITRPK
jgi:parvulin-like peptidyl-prolyl isomerase